MALRGSMISVTASDNFETDAYFVEPEVVGQVGIICVMEAFGLNDSIKQVADDYAADGFSVLAPALYDRSGKGQLYDYDTQLPAAVAAMQQNGFENPLSDVAGCIAFLQQQGIKRIGIVGYCYGGAVSWLAASRFDAINAAACYYGTAILHFADHKPRCPTMAHWGKTDPSTPEDQVSAVAAAHPEVTMYWYQAGHGFNSIERSEHFDEASATQARQRTLAFFNKVLRT